MLTLAQVVAGFCLVALSVFLNANCFVTVPPKFYFERICVLPFVKRRKLLCTGRHFVFPFIFMIQKYIGTGMPVQIPESTDACPARTIVDRVVHLKSGRRVVVDATFRYAVDARTFDVLALGGNYDDAADEVVDTILTEVAAAAIDDGTAFSAALGAATRGARGGVAIKFEKIKVNFLAVAR